MVPVGEGMGLTMFRRSGSGMWILSGEIWGYSGRRGDAGASSLWYRDVNWIFIAVLGKRKVHLQQEGEQEVSGGQEAQQLGGGQEGQQLGPWSHTVRTPMPP